MPVVFAVLVAPSPPSPITSGTVSPRPAVITSADAVGSTVADETSPSLDGVSDPAGVSRRTLPAVASTAVVGVSVTTSLPANKSSLPEAPAATTTSAPASCGLCPAQKKRVYDTTKQQLQVRNNIYRMHSDR